MKRLLLCFFTFSVIASSLSAQNNVVTPIEQIPEFAGGKQALYQFLIDNLRYPDPAQKLNIKGKVKVKFAILEDGSISNVEVVQKLGYGLDDEAIRVISKMPKWRPAIHEGKPVKIYVVLPIVW